MREILFRGKKLCYPWDADYDMWFYGDLWQDVGEYRICDEGMTSTVFADTVGQYTGLTDKNGKKIFEGDVVNLRYFVERINPNSLGAYEDDENIIGVIKIQELGIFIDGIKEFKKQGDYLSGYMYDYESEDVEVIGNIYDNPELLKRSGNDEE